ARRNGPACRPPGQAENRADKPGKVDPAAAGAEAETAQPGAQRLPGDVVHHAERHALEIVETQAAAANGAQQTALEHLASAREAVDERAIDTAAHPGDVVLEAGRVGPHFDDELR